MPFYALTHELLSIALTTCKPVIMRTKYHKGNRRFTDVVEVFNQCPTRHPLRNESQQGRFDLCSSKQRHDSRVFQSKPHIEFSKHCLVYGSYEAKFQVSNSWVRRPTFWSFCIVCWVSAMWRSKGRTQSSVRQFPRYLQLSNKLAICQSLTISFLLFGQKIY